MSEPVPAAAPAPRRPPEVWSPAATVGWGLLIGTVYLGIGIAIGALFVVMRILVDPDTDLDALARTLEHNGALLAIATFVSTLLVVPLVFLVAAARRGWPVRRYLAFHPVSARAMGLWLLTTAGLVVVFDATSSLLSRPIVHDFMREAYATAGSVPFLWLALVVGAPLTEEIFFRGFLYEGLSRSRLGEWGTILLTSVGWALLHIQYGAFEIAFIIVLGIALGLARWKTGSIWVPLAMHALCNLIATGETAWVMGRATG